MTIQICGNFNGEWCPITPITLTQKKFISYGLWANSASNYNYWKIATTGYTENNNYKETFTKCSVRKYYYDAYDVYEKHDFISSDQKVWQYTLLPTPNQPAELYGYRFDGWSTSGTTYLPYSESLIESDIYLYAVYSINDYTLNYDLNGGRLLTQNPTSYTVQDPDFTLNNPIREGYTFTGWTGSNGGTPETSVTITTGSFGNKSFVANWSVNNYTLTFDSNGGNAVSPSTREVTYDTKYGVLPVPTHSTLSFIGWYTDPIGGKQITAEDIVNITDDTTLYAHWSSLPSYVITFDNQDATTPGTESITATNTLPLPTITVPTKEGYYFVGYFTEVNGQGTRYFEQSGRGLMNCNLSQDTTLYAHWVSLSMSSTIIFNSKYTNGDTTLDATTPGTEEIAVAYQSPLPLITIPNIFYLSN